VARGEFVKLKKNAVKENAASEYKLSFAPTNQTGKVAKTLAVAVEGQADPVVADVPSAWTLEPENLRWDVGEALAAKPLTLKAAEGETLQIEKIFFGRDPSMV
jgi:hypothetical protein